jgi:hypothetical protein
MNNNDSTGSASSKHVANVIKTSHDLTSNLYLCTRVVPDKECQKSDGSTLTTFILKTEHGVLRLVSTVTSVTAVAKEGLHGSNLNEPHGKTVSNPSGQNLLPWCTSICHVDPSDNCATSWRQTCLPVLAASSLLSSDDYDQQWCTGSTWGVMVGVILSFTTTPTVRICCFCGMVYAFRRHVTVQHCCCPQ